ncbi:Uncharacterized protein HZ326_28561 [Fusarium oxysporum f. sp. albedinis]|nr:Uncharacterized protein HZ326_28561 [Fusarium oxysporum f. sp. albedinis]
MPCAVQALWPTDYREHATNLSRYLQKALSSIDNGNGQPIASPGVRVALIGALSLITKRQSIPELGHIHAAVRSGQAETKTAAENITH